MSTLLFSTDEVMEEYGLSKEETLSYADALCVAQIDGVRVWTEEDLDSLEEELDPVGHECDVCHEVSDDIDGKWISIGVVNPEESMYVQICNDCAASNEKMRTAFEMYLVEYRKLHPVPSDVNSN